MPRYMYIRKRSSTHVRRGLYANEHNQRMVEDEPLYVVFILNLTTNTILMHDTLKIISM